MESLFFILFAVLATVSALLVVVNPFSRNPVTSAMFLVSSMLSIAGLFVLLNAYFLAAVQVIVYAGAVIVLFLFVIMLLDLNEDKARAGGALRMAASMVVVGFVFVWGMRALAPLDSSGATSAELVGSPSALGFELFTTYIAPFEIVSALLLVSMVGVIYLSRKKEG